MTPNYGKLHNEDIAEKQKARKEEAQKKLKELHLLLSELQKIDKKIEKLLS